MISTELLKKVRAQLAAALDEPVPHDCPPEYYWQLRELIRRYIRCADEFLAINAEVEKLNKTWREKTWEQ